MKQQSIVKKLPTYAVTPPDVPYLPMVASPFVPMVRRYLLYWEPWHSDLTV